MKRPASLLILIFCAAIALLSVDRSGRSTQAETPLSALQGNAALEELKKKGVYDSLTEAFDAARYSVRQIPESGLFAATNPRQGFNARFSHESVEISSGNSSQWKMDLRLTGIGYGERILPVEAPEVRAEGSRIEMRRTVGDTQGKLTEWYVNRPSGLEQGFTVDSPPAERRSGETLRISMSLGEGWLADVAADGQSARLSDDTAGVTLDYTKLLVTDAAGADVPAWISTGEREIRINVDDSRAEYPLLIDPTITQQGYLKASNTDAGDWLGYSIAISGDTIVIGAFGEDGGANGVNGNQADNSRLDAGAAYVFVRTGGVWEQEAYLKASNTGGGDNFGYSVAVSGDTIVVGARQEDSLATGVNGNQADNSALSAGAAYVFVRTNGVWTQEAYLKASNTGSLDNFGYSVAVSGDTIVVGAVGEDSIATGVNGNQADNSATEAGAAYLFVRTNGVWSQQAYLKASNTGSADAFGISVAVSGDTVVVGARSEASSATGVNGNQADNSRSNAGAAYVFVRTNGAWSQEAYLKASNTGAGDLFGTSVAAAGDTIVVGALWEDSSTTGVNGNQADNSALNSGAAYVFVRVSGTWSQEAYLKASNTGGGDYFGAVVSVSGDWIVVGGALEDSSATGVNGSQTDNSATDAGAAYIFSRTNGAWVQEAYLKASNTDGGDQFGYFVAVSGGTVVVGANLEDSNATGVNGNQADNSAAESGAAYVFLVSGLAPTVSSLDPSTPLASNTDQIVTVNGSGFQNGLTVTVSLPSGITSVLSGTQIQDVTPTSFKMRITLGSPGNWSLRVNNPDKQVSGWLPFSVQSNIQNPAVFSMFPSTPFAGAYDQDVVVSGANFQNGLKVRINFPNGGSGILQGEQIQNLTPTSFIMRATLNEVGNWSIQVENPDGGLSPAYQFNVGPGGNSPVITQINPISPVAQGADQDVTVTGANFEDGLVVNVMFPDGGVSILRGTGQIQNVTSNAFVMRVTLNTTGLWRIRVVNPDNSQSPQFGFNVQPSGPAPGGLPTSVLSPVLGPIRASNTNFGWDFNQHKTGRHSPTGGISSSNDTFAWDINFYTPTNYNADAGNPVYAVADGEVVPYVGNPPGGKFGAVLIAHPNASNPVWYSGYLHMTDIRVAEGQPVNQATLIGSIGSAGATNDHLHFVVYSGRNRRGSLISFNVDIVARTELTTDTPLITGVNPPTVTQGLGSETITISGTNFNANSIVEVRNPNGRAMQITQDPVSVVDTAQITSTSSNTIEVRVPFRFSGTYTVSVINNAPSSGGLTNSSSYGVSNKFEMISSPGSLHSTPVIFIPGIMGSRLGSRRTSLGNTIYFDEIFPGLPTARDHQELRNGTRDETPLENRQIVATGILSTYLGDNVPFLDLDIYGSTLSTLLGYGGFKLYDEKRNPRRRTLAGCDTEQRDAN